MGRLFNSLCNFLASFLYCSEHNALQLTFQVLTLPGQKGPAFQEFTKKVVLKIIIASIQNWSFAFKGWYLLVQVKCVHSNCTLSLRCLLLSICFTYVVFSIFVCKITERKRWEQIFWGHFIFENTKKKGPPFLVWYRPSSKNIIHLEYILICQRLYFALYRASLAQYSCVTEWGTIWYNCNYYWP